MRCITHFWISVLALVIGTDVSTAETIPCINPEVLELENNFRDGFHIGHLHQNFWGDADRELVLVNAEDETFYLEFYTSDEAVTSCEPDISLQLNTAELRPWRNLSTDHSGTREYGFHLALNNSNGITFEEFWYGGTRGIEHSNGLFTLKLLDRSTVEIIGWDSRSWDTQRYVNLSINFSSQRFVATCRSGILSGDGWRGEYWGTFDADPIILGSGDLLQLNEIDISAQPRYVEFVKGCLDPDNCHDSIMEDGSCDLYATPR